jgi:aminocarboxymuconate-semialdehyde decarboxylase
MDAAGIAVQALSPMPELLSYWFATDDAVAMAGVVNSAIADMVDAGPGRFVGLGMVPLQAPDRAVEILQSLMGDGRFRGIEIGTNVNGVSIGDARFEPFFVEAERLRAAVFVHALHPVGDERLVGPALLKAVISFPCETAFAVASLMTGGILSRHPGLKIAFSHGGGAFASILPRLQYGWETLKPVNALMEEAPTQIAQRLFFDTLVYDAPMLRHLSGVFGPESLLIGTDYPFDVQDRDPLGSLAAAGFSGEVLDLVTRQNPARFLGTGPVIHPAQRS